LEIVNGRIKLQKKASYMPTEFYMNEDHQKMLDKLVETYEVEESSIINSAIKMYLDALDQEIQKTIEYVSDNN
jgi:hypothetical protein